MQWGTENRTKTMAAIGLMVVALLFTVVRFFPSSPASAKSPAPSETRPAAQRRPVTGGTSGNKVAVGAAARPLAPPLSYDWLKPSEDTKYQAAGRNIFRAQIEIPKPIVKIRPPEPVVQQGPPPPPPINLKFFGFANKPGEPKKIFLSEGEDVFIAGEGDIVNRRYRILHITPVSVEVEDVLNNNRQSIPLTQG